jgi:sugar phosphate isomerase/epimerase
MKTGMPYSRRDFLKLGAVVATALQCPMAWTDEAPPAAKAKIPVGLQLYSVRQECEKDLPATLAAVAKMGYQGVEFAGYYGRDAKTLRKLLDDLGLKCCGSHIGLETLLGEPFNQTVEFNKVLDNKFLIVPGLEPKRCASKKAWQETAAIFNELSEKTAPLGLRIGYHNHDIEFKPLDGELPWDTFFGNTKKAVVMQIDTGNAMIGGADPSALLKRYPGRAATVHLKPFSKAKPNAILGEDELPWPELLSLCETVGATEWHIIEYESDAFPPLVSVEKCLQALRKLGR